MAVSAVTNTNALHIRYSGILSSCHIGAISGNETLLIDTSPVPNNIQYGVIMPNNIANELLKFMART